jgi:hypothetical protein
MFCSMLFFTNQFNHKTFRETGEKDVAFKVLYCGICHTDLHMIQNEWGNSIYPLVPGYTLDSFYYDYRLFFRYFIIVAF